MAIKTVFGDHATAKDGTFVVSSTKCVTGHTVRKNSLVTCNLLWKDPLILKRSFLLHVLPIPMRFLQLGAAGGLEAVVAAKSIADGVVPPTINYETPDPDCDLDYVPNEKRVMEVNGAMSTNLGFGGHNAAILFQKYVE